MQFKNLATPSIPTPWKISTGMFSNRQVGQGVDNIVNLTLQVGNVKGSRTARSLDSQVHVPNREVPPQDAAFRCLHWSQSVVVMELQPHLDASVEGPVPHYIHANGLSMFTSSLPPMQAATERDLFVILSAEQNYIEFLLKICTGTTDFYRTERELISDVNRLFPFRQFQ